LNGNQIVSLLRRGLVSDWCGNTSILGERDGKWKRGWDLSEKFVHKSGRCLCKVMQTRQI